MGASHANIYATCYFDTCAINVIALTAYTVSPNVLPVLLDACEPSPPDVAQGTFVVKAAEDFARFNLTQLPVVFKSPRLSKLQPTLKD